MTERRRYLMQQVMNGYSEIAPIMYHFDRYRRCDEMLRWLVMHRLVGQELLQLMRVAYENSPFLTAAFVLSKVKKEKKTQPVFAEKDYLIT